MCCKEISTDEVSADVTQDYSGQAVGIFTAAKMECHGYFNRADRNQHTVEVKILMPPKSGIFVTVVTPGPRVPFLFGECSFVTVVTPGPRVPVRATFDMATAHGPNTQSQKEVPV